MFPADGPRVQRTEIEIFRRSKMLVSGVFWAESIYKREQMLPYDANNDMRKKLHFSIDFLHGAYVLF